MSDAQQTIAAVLAAHERTGPPLECRARHDYGCCEECGCGCVMAYGDWAAHVAAEVDSALGTLTREGVDKPEFRNTGVMIPNRLIAGPDFVPERRLHFIPHSRWVSGWTPNGDNT